MSNQGTPGETRKMKELISDSIYSALLFLPAFGAIGWVLLEKEIITPAELTAIALTALAFDLGFPIVHHTIKASKAIEPDDGSDAVKMRAVIAAAALYGKSKSERRTSVVLYDALKEYERNRSDDHDDHDEQG